MSAPQSLQGNTHANTRTTQSHSHTVTHHTHYTWMLTCRSQCAPRGCGAAPAPRANSCTPASALVLSHTHSRAPAAHQYRHPIAHAQSQSHELWKASQRVCSRRSPVEHRSRLLLPGTDPIAALSSASSQLRLPPAVQLAGSVL